MRLRPLAREEGEARRADGVVSRNALERSDRLRELFSCARYYFTLFRDVQPSIIVAVVSAKIRCKFHGL